MCLIARPCFDDVGTCDLREVSETGWEHSGQSNCAPQQASVLLSNVYPHLGFSGWPSGLPTEAKGRDGALPPPLWATADVAVEARRAAATR